MGIFGSPDASGSGNPLTQFQNTVQDKWAPEIQSGSPMGQQFQSVENMMGPFYDKLSSLLGYSQQQSAPMPQQPSGPVGSTSFNPWQQAQAYTPNPGIDTSSLPQPQSYQPANPSTPTAQGMSSLMNSMPGSNVSPPQYSFPMTGGGMVNPYQGYGSLSGINLSNPQLAGGANPAYTMGAGERSFSDTASPGMMTGLFGSGGSSSSGAN